MNFDVSLPQGFPDSPGLSNTAAPADTAIAVAVPGQAVTISDGAWFLRADFDRAGPDLHLTGPDGQDLVIRDYFNQVPPPDLTTADGVILKGAIATRLAGPVAPNQFAQAAPGAASEPIGRVETATGQVQATRPDGSQVTLNQGDPVFAGDILETGADGVIGIVFADESTFSLAEDGRMTLDEMIYDPGSQQGSMSVNLLQGAFTFVSGQIAKTDVDAMNIQTPTATIGIRGTAGGGNIGPDGVTTAALLPEIGFVGEMSISNGAGSQTINQPGQAINIASFNAPPSPPFVLTPQQMGQTFGVALNALPNAGGSIHNDIVQGANEGRQQQQAAQQTAQEAEAQQAEAEGNAAAAAEAEAAAAAEAETAAAAETEAAAAAEAAVAEAAAAEAAATEAAAAAETLATEAAAATAAAAEAAAAATAEGATEADQAAAQAAAEQATQIQAEAQQAAQQAQQAEAAQVQAQAQAAAEQAQAQAASAVAAQAQATAATAAAATAAAQAEFAAATAEFAQAQVSLVQTSATGAVASAAIKAGVDVPGVQELNAVQDAAQAAQEQAVQAAEQAVQAEAEAQVAQAEAQAAETAAAEAQAAAAEIEAQAAEAIAQAQAEAQAAADAQTEADAIAQAAAELQAIAEAEAEVAAAIAEAEAEAEAQALAEAEAATAEAVALAEAEAQAAAEAQALAEAEAAAAAAAAQDDATAGTNTTSTFQEVLNATTGNDDLVGGSGNTQFTMYQGLTLGGTDFVDGGGGTDEITLENLSDFQGKFNALNNTMTYATSNNSVSGTIDLTSVEQLYADDGTEARVRLNITGGTSGYGYIVAGDTGNNTISVADTAALSNISVTSIVDSSTLGTILFGGAGNDSITGSSAEDIIYGGAGYDTLTGGAGNDSIYGGAGNDTITVQGSNYVDGGTGTDTLTLSNSGDSVVVLDVETITGGSGNDQIDLTDAVASGVTINLNGGTTDKVLLGDFANTVTVTNTETVVGGVGTDSVTIGGTGSTTTALSGVEIITGGSGNDTITALTGLSATDTVTGGTGTDSLHLSNTGNTLSGVTGFESITGGSGTDSVTLTDVANTLKITNIESLTGGISADTITVGAATTSLAIDLLGGANSLTLANGTNTISLASNLGTLNGGTGNDTINITDANGISISNISSVETINGGVGVDSLSLQGGTHSLTLSSIASVTGSTSDDSITLHSTHNGLTVVGGSGSDNITLANGVNAITLQDMETVTGGSGVDTLTITGSSAGRISGNDSADAISVSGTSGVQTIILAGASEFGDTITGFTAGAGGDKIDFNAAFSRGTSDAFQSLATSGAVGTNAAIVNYTTSIANYSTATDVATALNTLTGLAAGNKILFVTGNGTDSHLWYWQDTANGTVESGELLSVAELSGVVNTGLLAENFPTVVNQAVANTQTVTMTVSTDDIISGGAGTNEIITLSGAAEKGDSFDGLAGADSLTLGNTANVISVSNTETITGGTQSDDVTLATIITAGTVDLAGGSDSLTLANGTNSVTVANTEIITGGSGNDTLTLNAAGTYNINLLGGVDTISIAAAAAGTYDLTLNNVSAISNASNSSDTINIANAQNGLSVRMGSGAGTDTLVLQGVGNTISVWEDVEVVTGSTGNDHVTVETSLVNGATYNLGAGTDTVVLANGANTLSVSDVETITGGINGDTITYTSLALSGTTIDGGLGVDTLTLSNTGNNAVTVNNMEIITGNSGDDSFTVIGSASATLTGGAGSDTFDLSGSSAAQNIRYTSTGDGAAAGTSSGYDTITGFLSGTDNIFIHGTLSSLFDDVSLDGIVAASAVSTNGANLSSNEVILINSAVGTGNLFQSGFTDVISKIGTITAGTALATDVQNDAIFVMNDGTDTGIFLYTNGDGAGTGNTTVESTELTLLAVVDTTSITSSDIAFAGVG